MRTYEIRTLGCQMNVHDSERMAGLLAEKGLTKVAPGSDPDVIVINTCAVRENADNKLYGHLGQLAPAKRARPDMQIAVAGCLAQKDRGLIAEKAPWVDVVLGTHNLDSLPVLLDRAQQMGKAQVEIKETLQAFPSDLPVERGTDYSAWVSVSVGCNNSCTFCIVPALRGREKDRRPGDILTEVEALVAVGVREVTLLGQNVNAYGVEFGDRQAFSKLLGTVGAVPGIQRVRFTSPHPRDFTSDVIAAMAETPTVMPHLHMPLQSGSDAVLRRMRRSYRSAKYLGILAEVRAQMPHAAITTDIIVGFPGETEADFQDTLAVVEEAQFSGAFTFQYSKRPGTPAAEYEDQIEPEVVAERYGRLSELVTATSWKLNTELVGTEVEVMITEAARADAKHQRVSGRARDNRLVHLGDTNLNPGDIVRARVTRAAPHYLEADGEVELVSAFAASSCQVDGPIPLGLPVIPA